MKLHSKSYIKSIVAKSGHKRSSENLSESVEAGLGFSFTNLLTNSNETTSEGVSVLVLFLVSDKYFIVKKHVFFGTRTGFRINDMNEVVFETRAKMPKP